MKSIVSTTNLIACAVIAGAFTAGFMTGPALAEEQPADARQPFKFEFTYGESEITSAAQAEKLLVRLRQDVRGYCGGDRKMSLDERRFVNACIDQTMADTISKFGSATVAQAYNKSRADG